MIALCLPGGGAAGANQAGMLKALSERLAPGDVDLVCGASVGSLNGALYVQGDTQRLEDVWTNIGRRSIYWPVPTLWSMVWNKPLRNLIKKNVDLHKLRGKSTVLLAQACRYRDSQETVFDQWNEDFMDGLLASAAIPVIFPAVKIRDDWYVDGGVHDNSPMMPIMRYFVESAARDLEIVVLHCDPQTEVPAPKSRPRLLPQTFHIISLLLQAGQHEDTRAIKYFMDHQKLLPEERRKRVRVREVFPSESIPMLSFSKKRCREGFYTSYERAQKRLEEVLGDV